MRLLGGPLLDPENAQIVVGRFELDAAKEYAFVCTVPDFSHDPPIPHVVSGMHTETFRIE